MPSINRSSIISGPAIVQFGGQTFWSKGDVKVDITNDLFEILTSTFGPVDERASDRRVVVSFEPSGAFTSGVAAVLWPYAGTAVGTSLFGSSDSALVVHGRDGRKITVHAAAVTKMPSIFASVSRTMIGEVTFTGLLKNNTDPTNAAAYLTEASVAYPGDTGFAVSDILTKAYSSVWGASSPWSSFSTEAGWTIDFDLSLAEQKVDGLGTVDMTLASLKVSAKSIPVGPTAADILAKVNGTGGLGASIATSDNLNISATGVYLRLYRAALQESGLIFGSEAKRVKESTWIATRGVTSGTADPLFFVGTAAPA